MNKLRVVIPLYTDRLKAEEWRSLECVARLLGGKYPITAVCPAGKELGGVFARFPSFGRCDMDANYFVSVDSYNVMMLGGAFYRNFADDEFILIYQTDCWLFDGAIERFLESGADYIGAPWVPKSKYGRWYMKAFVALQRAAFAIAGRQPLRQMINYRVGNGGLSLRRVAKFIETIDANEPQIASWLSDNKRFCPEDVYFSLFAPALRVAELETGLRFSFDTNPDQAYALNGNRMPMGCHAWDRPNMWRFWRLFPELFEAENSPSGLK